MNELLKKAIGLGAAGFFAAAIADLRKYALFRKENPGAKFDWVEAFINWGLGFASGFAAGFGISGASGALGVSL